jgi:hypothetical protein
LDPAFYTLLGALGGISITQVANYCLENKKSKNLISLKKVELAHQKHHELLKERRIAYSNYLEAVDKAALSQPKDLSLCVGQLYSALILASDSTSEKISTVLTIMKEGEIDTIKFIKAKKELYQAMQHEIQV